MSEMSEIYEALRSAEWAAEALMTWQKGADGRDRTRSYQQTIAEGMRAWERLNRNLREGRQHIEPPPDFKRTSCGCGDPGACPPCSWCTDPENNPDNAED